MRPHRFKNSNFVIVLTLSLLSIPLSQADVPEEEMTDANWIEHVGRDLIAPVSKNGLPFLLMGSAASAAAYPIKNRVKDLGEDRPLGSWSGAGYRLGFWTINVAYMASFALYGTLASDSEAIRKSLMMVRATVATGIITTGIKAFHFEQRPRHNGDRLSFPSGHSSNAFAFAGVIQRNHGWWFGGPAFAGATFVGLSRINDNAHYLHDVIFGATLGLSYAFGLDPSWSNRDHSKSIALAPLFTEGRYGAGLTIDF